MDREFAVMCIPRISMGLRCAECAGCTLIFRKIEYSKLPIKGWVVRGNFISILNIDIFNYVILMDSI